MKLQKHQTTTKFMNQILNSLALFGAVAMCGCSTTNSGVGVTTNTYQSAPIGTYHTYAVKPAEHGAPLSQPVDAAVRDSLRQNLAARGIREASANERADLTVTPQPSTQQRTLVQPYNDWVYTGGTCPYYVYFKSPWPPKEESYTEEILLLEFVDTSSQKVVLRGQLSEELIGQQMNAANIDGAVKKIVAVIPAGTPQYAAQ
jgi:hypothetical protein